MNKRIRMAIENYVKTNGAIDSRVLIAMFAKQFSTTKQRISGNISYMVCNESTLSIIRNRPHSILY